ncbi:MAG: AAA family ATPase, partial [Gordonibacter sp.]|uniref:AAA family ATPase n=1 Tax=Gordonibacter sp. TaxID=1968902 RepID=UPI002FCB84A7
MAEIVARMKEPREFMQMLVGPRQTGKSTAIGQVLNSLDIPYHLIAADDYSLNTEEWFASEWRKARMLASSEAQGALFVVDEVQKLPHWAAV